MLLVTYRKYVYPVLSLRLLYFSWWPLAHLTFCLGARRFHRAFTVLNVKFHSHSDRALATNRANSKFPRCFFPDHLPPAFASFNGPSPWMLTLEISVSRAASAPWPLALPPFPLPCPVAYTWYFHILLFASCTFPFVRFPMVQREDLHCWLSFDIGLGILALPSQRLNSSPGAVVKKSPWKLRLENGTLNTWEIPMGKRHGNAYAVGKCDRKMYGRIGHLKYLLEKMPWQICFERCIAMDHFQCHSKLHLKTAQQTRRD